MKYLLLPPLLAIALFSFIAYESTKPQAKLVCLKGYFEKRTIHHWGNFPFELENNSTIENNERYVCEEYFELKH